MPQYIDTHAHLYSAKFEDDREAVLARARQVCHKVLLPNIDRASIPGMHALAEAYPDFCYPMMGLHPTHVLENWPGELEYIGQVLHDAPDGYCAVGEAGIDLHWDKSRLKEQEAALQEQFAWAKALDKPIVLHVRDSFAEILTALEAAQDGSLRGVVHCFTGDAVQARRITQDLGFHLGIGGVLTFKNGGLPPVLAEVDPKWLLLETDAPYLAPAPHRGKRNESSYITLVAEKLAEVYDWTPDKVAEVTNASAEQLFFG